MCQRDWATDAQIAGKTLFLSASVRVFLEKTSIWFSILCKEHSPSPMGVGIGQSLKGPRRIKMQKKGEFLLSFLELRLLFSLALGDFYFLRPWCACSQAFKTYTSAPSPTLSPTPPTTDIQTFSLGLNHATTFLALQLADVRLWTSQPP